MVVNVLEAFMLLLLLLLVDVNVVAGAAAAAATAMTGVAAAAVAVSIICYDTTARSLTNAAANKKLQLLALSTSFRQQNKKDYPVVVAVATAVTDLFSLSLL
jgi:hypothetical protein